MWNSMYQNPVSGPVYANGYGVESYGYPTEHQWPQPYEQCPPMYYPRPLPPLRSCQCCASPMGHQDPYYGPEPRLEPQEPHVAPAAPYLEPQQPREETGGISSQLDYDLQSMSDWLSMQVHHMYAKAVPILAPQQGPASPRNCSSAFHKFVHHMLVSTRLPSSTILTGVLYAERRLQALVHAFDQGSKPETSFADSRTLYLLVTVALALANKFLDDNTFTNRSWAEVTGLSLQEISSLELEWLGSIHWTLGLDRSSARQPHERHDDFWKWFSIWDAFVKDREMTRHNQQWQCVTPPYSQSSPAMSGGNWPIAPERMCPTPPSSMTVPQPYHLPLDYFVPQIVPSQPPQSRPYRLQSRQQQSYKLLRSDAWGGIPCALSGLTWGGGPAAIAG